MSSSSRLGGDSKAGVDESPAQVPAHAQPAPTLSEHEAERRKLANEKAKNLLAYGKVYAYGALLAMVAQILIADSAFYLYGNAYHWKIPVGAMQVWLGATVVQVIGVVLVIARSLFPEDKPSSVS